MITDQPELDYQRHIQLQKDEQETYNSYSPEILEHIKRMELKRDWLERLRNRFINKYQNILL